MIVDILLFVGFGLANHKFLQKGWNVLFYLVYSTKVLYNRVISTKLRRQFFCKSQVICCFFLLLKHPSPILVFLFFILKRASSLITSIIKNNFCEINHNSLSFLMLSLFMRLDNNHLKVEDFSPLIFVLLYPFHKERSHKGVL